MIKVLVADENLESNFNCCKFLANDKTLEIISSSNGIDVLNKYYEIHPDILVINSDFKDKSYTEIINDISSTSEERNNSNVIITLPDSDKLFDFNYLAKIYKSFKWPIEYNKIKDSIEQYTLDKFIFYEPTDSKLTALFYKLNLYNDFEGADYFKYAIQECYKNPKLMHSLDDIYILVAKKFDVSYKSVRPAMRNALSSVIDYRNKNKNHGLFKLFENEDDITPKVFIRIITTNYLRKK
jgi:hypothetical protein